MARGSQTAASPRESQVPSYYLKSVVDALSKSWPDNRTVNIVCHGHSVPAGYFQTPRVQTFDSYPHLLHVELKDRFPSAVVNVIVTAIGGEDSERGAARFRSDVLALHPDVVTIDYALNDRRIGVQRAERAYRTMIQCAIDAGSRVILLTPTFDLEACLPDLFDPTIASHADQIRALAQEHGVGLADSYAAFHSYCDNGGRPTDLMSQSNHPNRAGHRLIVRQLLRWFD